MIILQIASSNRSDLSTRSLQLNFLTDLMVAILKRKAMEQLILLVSMNMTSDKVEKKTKSCS